MPVLGFNTQPSNSIISARNGLTKVGSFVELGGTLIHDTTIAAAGFDFIVTNINFVFGISDANSTITAQYSDAQTDSAISVAYDSGTGYSTTGLQNIDIATSNETFIGTSFDSAGINFLDATIPGISIKVKTSANGVEIEGNRNDATTNTYWNNWDGATANPIATLYNNGDWQWNLYPNTRDDSGTFTPTSFLYPGANGEIYNAPLSALSAGWALTGNTGLTDGVDNFIGTTDDVPLNFLVNNVQAGRIETDVTNQTFFGFGAGSHNTGIGNTAIGTQAYGDFLGTGTTTGGFNTAIGNLAMGNSVVGSNNVALGVLALNNTGEDNNTAIGMLAGSTWNLGTGNTYIGFFADANADNIDNCIAIGANALVLSSNEFAIGTQTHLNFELNGATVGYVLTCDAANSQIWKPQAASSNTDTPTLSNTVNITASSVNVDTFFIKVVDPATGETIITAQYSLLINATTTLTLTTIDVTLPVTANPSADLAGQGAYNNNNAPVAASVAPVDSTHARVTFVPVATGSNYILSFSLSYRAN